MPASETVSPAPATLDARAEDARLALERRVDGVRSRSRLKFMATGLSLGVVVFIAAFLGFSLADILFKFSPSGRFVSLAATLFGIIAVGYWFIVRPWTRLGGAIDVAKGVEHAYPQLEEQLSTALEYGRDGGLALKTSSPALVGALLEQVAQKSEPLDFKRTIRWKEFAIALSVAFLFALAMGAFWAKDSRLFGLTFSRFLNPIGDLPAPTLTVIKSVEPGDDPAKNEVPVETSVPVVVELDGRMPPTATLSVWLGEGESGRWEDRVMDRGEDGKYRATLRRLLENTRYRVKAGDAETTEFKIQVYKLPEISEFTLRLEHPAYTGRGTETLAPGIGDVRALAGTTVHVDVTANTDLSQARVHFKSGREKTQGVIDTKDPRRSTLSFKLDKDDEYQIEIANTRNKAATGSLYLLKALKDRAPKVTIRKPEKDLMVHRSQTVTVEMTSEDDVGVRELGLSHSLGLEETKVLVRRLDPPATRADGKLVWELSNMALKGGEVIAYYAYALDNDTIAGPKQAKSDIHFLTVYDEQEYENQQNPRDPNQPRMQTPPAVRQLDKLIDIQKKILRETFAQARQREGATAPLSDAEKTALGKTAGAQSELKSRVDTLLKELKEELERGEATPGPNPNEGQGQGPGQQGPQMGEKEIGHIEKASEKMKGAVTELKKPDAVTAVPPEIEALRHLSETRRLLLSDQEGDPRFKSAANRQSKKQQQQDRDQQQQDQQQAREELAELPKMMERENKVERELEQLNERRRQNPPNAQPRTEAEKREQEEQRRLQRQAQEELEKLAKEAEERARKLDRLAERNPDMRPAADKMEEAARSLQKAAQEAKKQEQQAAEKAQQQAQTAQSETKDAQRSLRNALEKQIRNELANAAKDAQELAQKQNDLAQQAREMNQQQNQQGQQQSGQQQQGQQQQGQQQGQQQAGQQQGQQGQQGQQPQGQQAGQQQGQQAQGGQQGQQGQQQGQQGQQGQGQQQGQSAQSGKPQPGQGQGQGQSAQQQMAGMGRQQRDIQNDLKELAERLRGLSERAGEKGLGGAAQIDQAGKQAGQGSAASESTQKAQEALGAGKGEEAQREAAKASKALDQLAQSLQEAVSKTGAADMKELAGAMRKLQGLSKEQGDVNKDASQRRDANQLASKQEKVGEGAKEIADAAAKLEALRRAGRERSAASHLDEAAKQAAETAKALRNQDFNAAKEPGEKAERALNMALNDMEMAAGTTLQEKAREAQNVARAAREKQVAASEDTKQIAAPDAKNELTADAAKQRDEAVGEQQQAAREARRLKNALEGLEELAKDANPAAAEIAREARENLERKDVQKNMEDLARGLEALGQKKRDPAAPEIKPVEAAKKGEELVKELKDVEKNLDEYIAEAIGNQLDRLRAMEQAAREASEKSKELAKQNSDPKTNEQGKPNETAKGEPKSEQKGEQPGKGEGKEPSKTAEKTDPKAEPKPDQKGEQPGDKLAELARDLQRLQPRLDRLEPNAPERVKMREAATELDKLREASRSTQADPKSPPAPGVRNNGGPAFQRIAQSLDEVVGGLHERVERIQRARDIRPEADEEAPKEYRTLVDRYYRALSEDSEDEKK